MRGSGLFSLPLEFRMSHVVAGLESRSGLSPLPLLFLPNFLLLKDLQKDCLFWDQPDFLPSDLDLEKGAEERKDFRPKPLLSKQCIVLGMAFLLSLVSTRIFSRWSPNNFPPGRDRPTQSS